MIFLQRMMLCLIVSGIFVITDTEHRPAMADTLVDRGKLQREGLTRPWFTQVQMDVGKDRVESVNFDGELLTVQTKRGVIQTIDGETGDTLWVTNVDSPTLFTSSVGVGPNHTALANGSHLLVFERKTGKQVWSRKLSGGVIGAPGVSKDFIFVPKVDGKVEVYSLDEPRSWKEVRSVSDTQFPVWRYNSHGKTMIQPAIFDGLFGWANDRASFYVARIKPMEILFRLETFENVVAPPVKINSYLYIVSSDGYLYKVHVKTGDIRWRFSTGTPLISRPVALDGFIYISTPDGGLYRILADEEVAEKSGSLNGVQNEAKKPNDFHAKQSLKEGNESWFNPDIAQILSITPDRVFGLDPKGNMQIVDTETGKSLRTVKTGGVSIPITNHLTDRIYLASTNGLIQCIETSTRSPVKKGVSQNADGPEFENDDDDSATENEAEENNEDSETFSNDTDQPADDAENPFE